MEDIVNRLMDHQAQLTQQIGAIAEALRDRRGGEEYHRHQHPIQKMQTKSFEKLPQFSGRIEDWQEWAFKWRSAASSSHCDAGALLEWAEGTNNSIDEEDIDIFKANGSHLSHEFYHQLVLIVSGDALEIVRNTSMENGLEAWRKLHKRYNPSNPTRALQLLREAIHPQQPKGLEEVEGCIDRWETTLRRLERDFKETLSDKLKIAVALNFCPDDLQASILRNAEFMNNYTELKEKITSFTSVKRSMTKPNPLDVNSWEAEDGWRGEEVGLEALGKGGGGAGGVYCYRCGGAGHMTSQCPTTRMICRKCGGNGHMSHECPSMKGQGKGKDAGKGTQAGWKGKGGVKGQKGSGKTMQAGEFNGYCNLCGKWGHRAAQCWGGYGGGKGAGKATAAMEEEQCSNENHDIGGLDMNLGSIDVSTPPGIEIESEAKMKDHIHNGIDKERKKNSWQTFGSRFRVLQDDANTDTMELDVNAMDCSDETKSIFRIHEEETKRVHTKITVDSGAAEHVIPTGMVPQHLVQEGESKRKGVHYIAANGSRIPNRGQRRVRLETKDSTNPQMTFQITDVKKPLASVAKICGYNNRVIFDDEGSYIENKITGERINIAKENNTYVIDCMMKLEDECFHRPGR